MFKTQSPIFVRNISLLNIKISTESCKHASSLQIQSSGISKRAGSRVT